MSTDRPWWTPEAHADRRPFLAARARIKTALRGWFETRGFIEVEPSCLQASPGNEAHLHAFRTELIGPDLSRRDLYLHTSPELACKKLLAAGETKIFAFAPVFRNRECGALHAPEFTMLEWYRAEAPYEAVMDDCAALLKLAAETADNRFVLFVNGARIASGPSTGTLARWRYSTVDLAPHLRRGSNVIAATVWNFGEAAPMAQVSLATGFRLTGEGISTGEPGWRVAIDPGHSALKGNSQIDWQYYVASAPEVIDGSQTLWGWDDADEPGSSWRVAVPAPEAARRTLAADTLPAQWFIPAQAGTVVRTDLAGGAEFPARPVTVPAHATAKLLLRRDAVISAYPALDVAGGKGASISLEYGEALYDAARRKGDRNLVEDRQVVGFHDRFMADGGERSFSPLWWRTFRFIEIEVTTADQPLTLRALRLRGGNRAGSD